MAQSMPRAGGQQMPMEKSEAGMSRHKIDVGYFRFFAMILTSMVVMFLLTYTNSYSIDHVHWSEERFYMSLQMGSAMGVVMLAFMWQMHPDRTMNIAILVVALGIGVGALWLSRSQQFVGDQAYMRGMIPHHSIAILTSERADIEDVRVRELSNEISQAQKEEIREMEWLLEDISAHGKAETQEEAARRPVPDLGD